MIDTCDPKIAGWSEDGKTFVVRDPNKFERSIIPQFFKHNKFTSFVRVSLLLLLILNCNRELNLCGWFSDGADRSICASHSYVHASPFVASVSLTLLSLTLS